MKLRPEEFFRIREICMKKGLNVADVLDIYQSLVRSEKESNKSNIAAKPASIVTEIINRARSGQLDPSLEAIVGEVSQEFINQNIDNSLLPNTPLIGYVGHRIFSNAQLLKSRNSKIKGRRKNPVSIDDLAKYSRINFSRDDAEHIVGILDPEYVREQYPIETDLGMLADKEGSLFSIEGERAWEGENKELARQMLARFIDEKLLGDYDRTDAEAIHEQIMEIDDKIQVLPKTRKQVTGYRIKFGERGAEITFKDHNPIYDQITNIPGIEINRTPKTLELRWKSENAKRQLNSAISQLMDQKNENKKNYLQAINTQEIKERVNLEQNIQTRNRLATKKLTLESRLDELETRQEKLLEYFGLEGPGFASYLQLVNLASARGRRIKAILPEYDLRLANLMQSVATAHEDSGYFDDVIITHRDVNDMILLDFVKDSDFEIIHSNGGMQVAYAGRQISLDDYRLLLEDIDDKRLTDSTLKKKYNVNQTFLEGAKERHNPNLDVVYLDYFNGETDKRQQVLEHLIPRLNDEAVIAITTNTESRYNHLVDPKEILDKQFDRIFDLQGVELVDVSTPKTYRDGEDEMLVIAYHVRKK